MSRSASDWRRKVDLILCPIWGYRPLVLRRRFLGGAFLLAWLAGCASTSPPNQNGKKDLADQTLDDMGAGEPDLYGADLFGLDLKPGPDLWAPCSPVAQSGCAMGEKCTLTAMSVRCVVDGDKATGALCGGTSADDCIKGNLCVIEGTSLNQCRQFCSVDGDCKKPGPNVADPPHCLLTFMNTTAKACTVACNPVLNLGAPGCAAGMGCQIFAATGIAQATDCTKVGAGLNDTDCAANGNDDCANGYGCVTQTSGTIMTKKCRKVCRLSDGNAHCAGVAGTGCVSVGTNLPYGFCL
jgi:hypothetical protein